MPGEAGASLEIFHHAIRAAPSPGPASGKLPATLMAVHRIGSVHALFLYAVAQREALPVTEYRSPAGWFPLVRRWYKFLSCAPECLGLRSVAGETIAAHPAHRHSPDKLVQVGNELQLLSAQTCTAFRNSMIARRSRRAFQALGREGLTMLIAALPNGFTISVAMN